MVHLPVQPTPKKRFLSAVRESAKPYRPAWRPGASGLVRRFESGYWGHVWFFEHVGPGPMPYYEAGLTAGIVSPYLLRTFNRQDPERPPHRNFIAVHAWLTWDFPVVRFDPSNAVEGARVAPDVPFPARPRSGTRRPRRAHGRERPGLARRRPRGARPAPDRARERRGVAALAVCDRGAATERGSAICRAARAPPAKGRPRERTSRACRRTRAPAMIAPPRHAASTSPTAATDRRPTPRTGRPSASSASSERRRGTSRTRVEATRRRR